MSQSTPNDGRALQILPATAADVATILGLIRELAEFEKLQHEVSADEPSLAQALFGPRPYAECLLARFGDEVVGFALFFHNFSTFLARPGIYLEDLYVKPEHRGRGAGEALLRHVAKLAVERGCGRFEWSVLDWNERAIAFYTKLGARPQSEWQIFRTSGEALAALARDP